MTKNNKYWIAIFLIFIAGVFIGQLWETKQSQWQQEKIKSEIKINKQLLDTVLIETTKLEKRLDVIEKKRGTGKIFIATAYCNDRVCINVLKWRDGKTAMGTIARIGIVAVDPEVIPLGTKVYIKGFGWFKAEDVGGKIKGNRIDIFLGNYEKAKKFGRREVLVYW